MGEYAFCSCANLIDVTVNFASGATMEPFAFAECESLETVTLGAGVYTIRYASFKDCVNLAETLLPDTITSLEGSYSREEGVFAAKAFKLCYGAFMNCDELEKVVLPDRIKELGLKVCVWRRSHPYRRASISELLKTFEHFIDRIGSGNWSSRVCGVLGVGGHQHRL